MEDAKWSTEFKPILLCGEGFFIDLTQDGDAVVSFNLDGTVTIEGI